MSGQEMSRLHNKKHLLYIDMLYTLTNLLGFVKYRLSLTRPNIYQIVVVEVLILKG